MTTEITFQFEDIGTPNLVFIKTYRSQTNEGQKETRYTFYRANIGSTVAQKLKEWLLENIGEVNGGKFEEYDISTEEGDYEYVDLSGIENWEHLKNRAFTLGTQDEVDLRKVKSNLKGYMIYSKIGDNNIIGLVRKITQSSVLDKRGIYRLYLAGSAFNEIKEERNVELDKYADLVFKTNNDVSEGVVLNKPNFNSIFDIQEQQRRQSMDVLDNLELIEDHPQREEIVSIVQEDRRFQKMLINPIVREHMNEVTFDIIRTLKQEIPNELAFDIDEPNEQIIFQDENKKEGIHDFIKVIGWRYSRTVDLSHIIEGTPSEVVK